MMGEEVDQLSPDLVRFGAVSVYRTRDDRFRVSYGPDVLPVFAGPGGRWFVSVVDADDVLGEILQSLGKAVGPNGPPWFGLVLNRVFGLMSFELDTVFIFPTDCGFYITAPSHPDLARFEVDSTAAANSALRFLEECQKSSIPPRPLPAFRCTR